MIEQLRRSRDELGDTDEGYVLELILRAWDVGWLDAEDIAGLVRLLDGRLTMLASDGTRHPVADLAYEEFQIEHRHDGSWRANFLDEWLPFEPGPVRRALATALDASDR